MSGSNDAGEDPEPEEKPALPEGEAAQPPPSEAGGLHLEAASPSDQGPGNGGHPSGSEGADGRSLPDPKLETWHHGRHLDKVSSNLAYMIVGLFLFVLAGPLVAIVFHWASESELDGYFKIAVPTVSGIVGSVVGFYFRAGRDQL